MKINLEIKKQHEAYSIRRFVRTTFPHLSQAAIHKSIRNKDILVNGSKVDIDHILHSGDTIQIWNALTQPTEPSYISQKYEYQFLKPYLIHQNEHFWVFNKPAGLAMQGGTMLKTSLNYLLTGWMDEYGLKPYLVHRLDRYTTGVCIVATNPHAAFELSRRFAKKNIHKTYVGFCENKTGKKLPINHTGSFNNTIDEKEALTHYTIKGCYPDNMLFVEFQIITGRKHQIRLHASGNNMPIYGDILYNPDTTGRHLHLHAYHIKNDFPTEITPEFSFYAPFPSHLKQFESFYLKD